MEDAQSARNRRRIFIVDKEMQYYYLSAWVIAAFLMICVFGFFFVMFRVLPVQEKDPVVMHNLYILLICNGFILILFSMLMGLHAVWHTHRIAGAATHIRNSLDRLLGRDYSYQIVLREKDYLKDMAGQVNALARQLKFDKERLAALQGEAERLQRENGNLSGPAREYVERAAREIKDISG